MAYNFHYTPTGTGVISGKEVLEQTEDAINDLGNTAISGVQEALDKAEQALTNSANAVDDAQTALNTANNAEGVAIQAQTDVGNLSGTVTNIGNRVTTAEGNISNLQGRMTTAEGNITNLQGRMTTAETNIGNLQTAVSTAQATANSAQQTATTARQQSYVFRYSGTAVVPNSTIAYSTIDNTDNIKSGDKILDVDGKLFEITAVDTTNQTVTVGNALIDLALDANVVHKSGNETVGGEKTFANNKLIVGRNTDTGSAIQFVNADVVGDSANGSSGFEVYGSSISDANKIGSITIGEFSNNGGSYATIECNRTVSGVKSSNAIRSLIRPNGLKELSATVDNDCKLGTEFLRWSKIYGTEYYYGSNNVEFSTKFVTTDTNQTISGDKTWSGSNTFQQNITYQRTNFFHQTVNPCYILKDTELEKGNLVSSAHTAYPGLWHDKNGNILGYVRFVEYSSGRQTAEFRVSNLIKNGTLDPTGSEVNCTALLELQPSGEKSLIPEQNNDINLGTSTNKWKTLNGVEPSSLSLPNYTGSKIDISSYITNLTGGSNNYTAPANGYIFVRTTNGTYLKLTEYPSGVCSSVCSQTADDIGTFIPAIANRICIIAIKCSSIDRAYFIPCQGNV